MTQKKDITKVVFRKFDDGEVIAIFPQDTNGRFLGSYMHIGQHGDCARDIATITRPASAEERAPLLKELRAIGYTNIQVLQRIRRY